MLFYQPRLCKPVRQSTMLRLSARKLARGGLVWRRGISGTTALQDEGDSDKGPKAFAEKFKQHVASNVAPPSFPSDFLPKDEKKKEEGAGVPDKLTLNLYLPHEQRLKDSKVDLVLLPAVTGDFGVMPGHVPTVAQLRPGVVTVHTEMDKQIEKFFVSSGFAFVNSDSTTDVVVVEAVKLEDLDTDAVRAGLQEYTAKLASVQAKGDDYEIAAAQIGVEVYSAMNSAVGA